MICVPGLVNRFVILAHLHFLTSREGTLVLKQLGKGDVRVERVPREYPSSEEKGISLVTH
jgi:hypothetical protein